MIPQWTIFKRKVSKLDTALNSPFQSIYSFSFSAWVQVALRVLPYLMVPVGEGSGEPNALMCSSCCCMVGMLILRGEMWGRSVRGGREGCSLCLCSSGSSSDINWILMTVLGKRNTHLREQSGGGEGKDKQFSS